MVQVAYACDATGESQGLLRSIIKRSSLLSSGIHNHSAAICQTVHSDLFRHDTLAL